MKLMVHHEHLEAVVGHALEMVSENRPVCLPEAAALDGRAVGGRQPEHGDLVGVDRGSEVVGDVPLVPLQGRPEPLDRPPPRIDIVVARHDKGRRPERIEHGPCRLVLRDARPLGQVATQGHKIDTALVDLVHQRLYHAGMRDPPEVKIGNVSDGHGGGILDRNQFPPGRALTLHRLPPTEGL
jgi:hypothetical protein